MSHCKFFGAEPPTLANLQITIPTFRLILFPPPLPFILLLSELWQDIIPSTNPVSRPRSNGRQTGPKGVLADHAYYKSVMSQAQESRTRAANARIAARAATTTTMREDEQAQEAELVIQELEAGEAGNEDREALLKYRRKRLEELQALSSTATKRKQFGSVQEITSAQYATAVDSEWRTVPVIVHLFDNVRHIIDIIFLKDKELEHFIFMKNKF